MNVMESEIKSLQAVVAYQEAEIAQLKEDRLHYIHQAREAIERGLPSGSPWKVVRST